MTKYQLLTLMTLDGTPRLSVKGVTGVLQTWGRECGDGRSFNLTILEDKTGKMVQVFVRTID